MAKLEDLSKQELIALVKIVKSQLIDVYLVIRRNDFEYLQLRMDNFRKIFDFEDI